MTKETKNIIKMLNSTGSYSPIPTGILKYELTAYDVGFSILEDEINSLLADLFIETASDKVLREHELRFRKIPSTESIDVKREMLLARYGDYAKNSSINRFKKLLIAAGIKGEIFENHPENSLLIKVEKLLGIPLEQAKVELETLMPAHLEIDLQV